MSERFIVAEASGYPMNMSGKPQGGSTWVTEYMVQDTAYCHRVVWTSLRNQYKVREGGRGSKTLSGRPLAEAVCSHFNRTGTRFAR